MARTLSGKLTGRAAATQKAEEHQELFSAASRVDLNSIRARLKQKEEEAQARCIELEGKLSFYPWYVNIDGSISERIEMIQARIQELEAEQRYTIVDNLLGAEGEHPFKIMDATEAMDKEFPG